MLLDVPDEASLGLRLFELSLAPPKGASFLCLIFHASDLTRYISAYGGNHSVDADPAPIEQPSTKALHLIIRVTT